jgi:predicted CoA-substrate-specific enzyme activase
MEDHTIVKLFDEKTPIRQKEYFDGKLMELMMTYSKAKIVSCGYGKHNVSSIRSMNELTALAKGVDYLSPGTELVLDIGGQDTKIIRQENGLLKEFFVNDKCAAGSGMFLSNIGSILGIKFEDIELIPFDQLDIKLSSVCAVFAQSEIVELIADNVGEQMIISAVVHQIFTQAKPLIGKVNMGELILSGGLTKIAGIEEYASNILNRDCKKISNASFLSAIGCALY